MAQYLSLDKAAIISTVLEGILYGFSVLMFMATIWILLRARNYSKVNRPMVVIACLLLILSTIHMLSDVKRIYTGLILHRNDPEGPAGWFAKGNESSFVFKNAVYSFQTALGDGVLIYRCYMVWRSLWVVLLPAIMWLAVCTTAAGSVYTASQPAPTSGDIFASRTGQWITAFYATTLACNVCSTALLSFKLWTIERRIQDRRVGGSRIVPVLLVVLDAGALYSITLLAALICFVLKSNGQYVVLDMATPIISIAFYMVILRVELAQKTRKYGGSALKTIHRTPLPRNDINMTRPMHVHIEQFTEVDPGHTPGKADSHEGS